MRTDFHYGQHKAQVLGGRGAQGQQAGSIRLDQQIKIVDHLVADTDFFGQRVIAGAQCLCRIRKRLFDETAHSHHGGLNAFKVAVKGRDDMIVVHCHSPYPIRPVI
jgi:hypothetical protein